MSLRADEIGRLRLEAQRIGGPASSPAAVVKWLVAVQAQDPLAARWALGARHAADSEDDVIAALDSGRLLRTHLMRGTWQYVTPGDLHWLLELLAPRVRGYAERRHHQLGLSPRARSRCEAVLARELEQAGALTRVEAREVLRRAGLPTHEQRLSHLLIDAELSGLLCSGPMKRGQSTWALVDARVPRRGRARSRDAALAELAHRYFASRGPATLADFRWWTGLTTADAKDAHGAICSGLESATVDGRTLWWAPTTTRGPGDALLPPFDEFLIAYQDRRDVLDPRHVSRVNAGGGLLAPIIVAEGRVVGTWRRTLAARHVEVSLSLFGAARRDAKALARHVEAYARFLGVDARQGRTSRGRARR
ncbi:MAG: AlkZ family DNA glycosylase [Myxococcaceae bacterium]|nr:AlkZ family DNA glycosylase [Myxococcaceae bacterium]